MNAILLAVLLTAATPPFEVQTLDGQTFDGPLTELSAQRLTVQTPKGPVSLETAKLVGLSLKRQRLSAAKGDRVCVELIGGSVVLGRQYLGRNDRAQLTLLNNTVLEMPVRDVLTVRFQWEAGAMANEWARLLGLRRDADLLVIREDEVLDYHRGVLHEVTEDTVRFDFDGDMLPVKRAKIYGLAYQHRAEGELPLASCRIIDASGSRWSAHTLTLADEPAERFHWTTPTGLDVSFPPEDVVHIDFSAGKIAYLSDLTAESIRWTPFFGTGKSLPVMEKFYVPRQDRNFDSNPLQLGGAQYSKGLALHSRTEVAYRLPDGFRRLLATAGIDDAVRPNGKVRLVVHGDANVLLETVVAGSDSPRPIDLDITGIRRLVILVDFADGVNIGDYLLLCDARIMK